MNDPSYPNYLTTSSLFDAEEFVFVNNSTIFGFGYGSWDERTSQILPIKVDLYRYLVTKIEPSAHPDLAFNWSPPLFEEAAPRWECHFQYLTLAALSEREKTKGIVDRFKESLIRKLASY